MTQQSTGKSLPRAGVHLARLVEYIEVGDQDSGQYGIKKNNMRLGFELLSKDDIFEHDGKKCSPVFRTFDIPASGSPKAKSYKLFTRINYLQKEGITSFAQLIGTPVLIKIVHKTSAKGKERAELDMDYSTYAPVKMDPITGDAEDVPVPEQINDSKVFLWAAPTTESWDTLYIDGTNDDGSSKNFIQNMIKGAENFSGSPLEKMLNGTSETPKEEKTEKKEEKKETPKEVSSEDYDPAEDLLDD